MNILIRPATLEDCDKLSDLYVSYLKEFEVNIDRADYYLFLKDVLVDAVVKILVSTNDTYIIGFAAYTHTYSPMSTGYMIMINDLFVISNKRGLGCGLKLLREIERISKDSNAKKIMLNTNRAKSITNLYSKIGYQFTQLTPMYKLV